jgi:hypothetical protein
MYSPLDVLMTFRTSDSGKDKIRLTLCDEESRAVQSTDCLVQCRYNLFDHETVFIYEFPMTFVLMFPFLSYRKVEKSVNIAGRLNLATGCDWSTLCRRESSLWYLSDNKGYKRDR